MTERQLRDALVKAAAEAGQVAASARALANRADLLAADTLASLKEHDLGSRRLPGDGPGEGDFGWHDDPTI